MLFHNCRMWISFQGQKESINLCIIYELNLK